MNKPKIKTNQYLVGHAEYSTGHILKIDKTLYKQEGDVYLLFESKDNAINYILKTIQEYPEIECWIENSKGEHVYSMNKDR